ncbi:DPOG2-like protein [Mya arenaria]|uniref:DPOG2-like protein n=1 Tax=Mya arenaria TaxID=6604 RepID=A0ABY7DR98_MYAAR|nr:DPOG2-like protein [Mya arenaria]
MGLVFVHDDKYSCNYANFTQKTEGEGGLQEVHLQYTSPWGPVTIETVKNRGQDEDGSLTRQIQEVVTYVSRELRKAGLHVLDTRRDSGDVDAQIHRNDEFGVPFTVTVNNNTIKTGNIQLRNRDTSIQETVPIGKLAEYIAKHVFYQPT